jgi:hypothetical protein
LSSNSNFRIFFPHKVQENFWSSATMTMTNVFHFCFKKKDGSANICFASGLLSKKKKNWQLIAK